jgi:hypothetical protein
VVTLISAGAVTTGKPVIISTGQLLSGICAYLPRRMQILPGNRAGLRRAAGETRRNPEHRTGWLDTRNAILLLVMTTVQAVKRRSRVQALEYAWCG